MAVKAFVLIQTEIEAAKTTDIVTALKEQGGEIKSVDAVTGPYDIIAVIEVETIEKIDTVLNDKIHSITGVQRTVTCLTI